MAAKVQRTALIDGASGTYLPKVRCAVSVTPLLRELLARAAHLPLPTYASAGSQMK